MANTFGEKMLTDLLDKMPTRKASQIKIFDKDENLIATIGVEESGKCPLCGRTGTEEKDKT